MGDYLGHRKLLGVKTWYNRKNGFFCIRLHYTADAGKRSQEWMAKARKGYPSERDWRQEMEIDFAATGGLPVFGDLYKKEIHSVGQEYVQYETLYRGWDFGFIHPAVVVGKINTKDQFHLIYEKMGSNVLLEEFAVEVIGELNKFYPNATFQDACDPAGIQHSDKAPKTDIEILNLLGVYPQFKVMHPNDRVKILRSMLAVKENGFPGFVVDEKRCPIVAEALQGAYKLGREEKPEKDGWYEHPIDALLYLVTTILPDPLTMWKGEYREHKAYHPVGEILDEKTGY